MSRKWTKSIARAVTFWTFRDTNLGRPYKRPGGVSGEGLYLFITVNDEQYYIRSYSNDWLPPIAGPFKTLKAAKVAYLLIGEIQ